MTDWSEDLSQHTLDEIVWLQVENRAWQRELRTKATTLVNSKLAKEISPEEYASKRDAAKTDASECKRRAGILVMEAWNRRKNHKPVLL